MKNAAESQRKSPTQERSKAIVSAIFEATVRILPQIGSHKITTRKIADLAGISVGSLYQYFPNKESVLGGLMDMMMNSEMQKFEAFVESLDGKSMEGATDAVVDFAVDLFLREKEKNREIYKRAPELGRITALLRLRQKVVLRLAEEMKKHHPGRTHEEYVRVSFIAVNSVMGVIHTMLFDETQIYSLDELRAELKSMLNVYFARRAEMTAPLSGMVNPHQPATIT